MLFVACSGFPVPVSRYWASFPAVEISDTELGMPGSGTVRRWIREAPDGFAFTALAPKQIGESGFRKTKDNRAHVEAIADLAEKLNARAVVFVGDESFKPGKATRAALKAFASWLPKQLATVVIDLPHWKPEDVVASASSARVVAAYDPLKHAAPPSQAGLSYVRLPGPAGRRSRYDEDTIQRLRDHCLALEEETIFCVFRNIDMQVNATQLLKQLKR